MTKHLSSRMNQLAMVVRDEALGRSMLAAERRLSALADARDGLVSLTHADTVAFPPPAGAARRYADAVTMGLNPFADFLGNVDVRDILAPRVSAFLGVDVESRTELVLTAGTQNALFAVMTALVDRGDKVLLSDPDYMTLEKTLRFLEADVILLPARPSETHGAWRMSLDDIEAGFRAGARLLVFSNPCNPTGTTYDADFLSAVARLCVEYDSYVLVDELYSRLVYEPGYTHLAAFPGMRGRCITTLGTSKTESMSGFRVGALVAPPEIVAVLQEVFEITALRASVYAQTALLGWLGPDDDAIAERVEIMRQLRDLTVERLREVPGLEVASPGGSAYLFPRIDTDLDDFEVAEQLVEDAGVLVFPGLCFGPSGQGSFRLCFAQDPVAWPAILDRVACTLTDLSRSR